MHHTLCVRFVERVGHIDGDLQRFRQRHRAAMQAVGECLTLEVFHDEVVHAVLRADVMQRADVRMIQRGDGFGLALHALAQFGVGREMRRQHLDGDLAAQPRVACPIDFAHAAGA